MSAELPIGSELAGYRIEALVGRGGMGIVYRAEQLRLGRAVALKVLAPGLADDEDFRARFERESRLAALIDHPNIVPVYEAGEADGLLFIAMRWVEGSDLGARIKGDGPFAPGPAVEILTQVAHALDAAHERGLVHRDVKPGNILIAPERGRAPAGHVYLTDFGIAKMTSSVGVTRTGMFLGTPDYAAPEQFEGRELDGRADVYALACLLYQCLTGSRPFERTTEIAVMYAHMHEPPPRVSEVRPDVTPALDAVIARGMAKSRDDRYGSCTELMEEAAAAVTGTAQHAVAIPPLADPTLAQPADPTVTAEPRAEAPAPPVPPPVQATAPPPPPPAPAREAAAPSRRRRIRLAAIGGVALVAVGVGVALALTLGGGDDGTEAATTAAATTAPNETAATTAAATTGAAETSSALQPEWARVDSGIPTFPSQELSRVAASAEGTAIAVGSAPVGPDLQYAEFWTLTGIGGDEGVDVSRQHFGEAGAEVAFGVAQVDEETVVAVGFRQPEPPAGDTDAAVWLSSGGEFEAVSGLEQSSTYEKMNRVVVESGTIVAVGAAGPGRSESGTPLVTDAAVWVSSDGGSSWEREDVDGLQAENYQEMRGIVAFGSEFVAVGYDGKDAAVWRSDGGSWITTGTPEQLWATDERPELDMRDVVSTSRLVAVGDVVTASGDRDGAVWLSSDAEAWERVEPEAMGGPGDQEVLGIVAIDGIYVAVGCSACDEESSAPAVWTSGDEGETWARVDEGRVPAFDGSQQMNSIAVVGDQLVAVGWTEAAGTRDAAVWTAPIG